MVKTIRLSKIILTYVLVTILSVLTGCASNPKNPQDPYEGFNRKVFKMNTAIDKTVFRPVAKGYDTVTPSYVKRRVTNFFSNVGNINVIANDILQLRVNNTLSDTGRFLFNSTLGIFGLFDVATPMGFPKRQNDFGITLARWGYHNSAYLVVPIIGPRTVRDAAAIPPDILMSPYTYVRPYYIGYAAYLLNVTNLRAALLPTDKLIDQAYDPYVFVRDAYLQNRQATINQALGISTTDTYVPGDEDSSNAAAGSTQTTTSNTQTSSSGQPTSVQTKAELPMPTKTKS
ncbi:MAG: VacJ family lipoprotein [Coxiellaceae bacterium]|nr:MAG: VacJ family lipoprotein [Coxiellaceae bacterium]